MNLFGGAAFGLGSHTLSCAHEASGSTQSWHGVVDKMARFSKSLIDISPANRPSGQGAAVVPGGDNCGALRR